MTDGKGIINVPSAEWKGASKLVLDVKLMNSKVEGGTGWGRGRAHGSAVILFPVGVSKLKEVVFHWESEGVWDHV